MVKIVGNGSYEFVGAFDEIFLKRRGN